MIEGTPYKQHPLTRCIIKRRIIFSSRGAFRRFFFSKQRGRTPSFLQPLFVLRFACQHVSVAVSVQRVLCATPTRKHDADRSESIGDGAGRTKRGGETSS